MNFPVAGSAEYTTVHRPHLAHVRIGLKLNNSFKISIVNKAVLVWLGPTKATGLAGYTGDFYTHHSVVTSITPIRGLLKRW